ENTNLVAKEVPQYIKRFMGDYCAQSVVYSTAPYQIVHQIPDALPTLHDPYVRGHELGFHHPEIRDQDLHLTRTFSTTWDNQGLAGIRDGAIWYRVHVDLSEAQATQPIGL